MTLVKRKIDLIFTYGSGPFGKDKGDQVTITGLRSSLSLAKAGGVSNGELNLAVWGMPLDIMQKLTVINTLAVEQFRANTVTIKAGDETSGTGLIFSGQITSAWADATNPPDIQFVVHAIEGAIQNVAPVPPVSFKGPVDVDTLFNTFARLMSDGDGQSPYTLENSGVVGTIDSPYWPGTVGMQIQAACRALRCQFQIDEAARVLAIWPQGGTRGGAVLDVSPQTGLIGYPQFTQTGIAFSMLFNPAIKFGQTIKMTSALGAANGTWTVNALTHSLDAELPGGQWFTHVEAYLFGHTAPINGAPA